MVWWLALVIVLGGMGVGALAAWISHGYEEDAETETAVWSRPRCGHCEGELTIRATTPAWWFRGLRCPHCGERASLAWLATALAVPTFGLVMLATWGTRAVLIPFLWLVPVLVVAAAVDIRLMLIPRKVAWWGAGVGAGLIAATSLWIGAPGTLRGAVVGGVCYFAFLFIVSIISPGGMGFGDVRLSLLLGLYLGWTHVMMPAVGLFLACLIGVGLGLGVRLASHGRQRHFPFGPGLALGTLLAIAFHAPILERLLTA